MNDEIPHNLLLAYFAGTADEQQVAALSTWIEASPEHAAYLSSMGWLDISLHQQLKDAVLDRLSEQGGQAFRPFIGEANAPAFSPDVLAELLLQEEQASLVVQVLPDETSSDPAEGSHVFREAIEVVADLDFVRYVARKLASKFIRSKFAKRLAAAAIIAIGVMLLIVFSGPSDTPNQTPLALTPEIKTPQLEEKKIVVATLTAESDARWAERALASGSDLHAGQRLTLIAGVAEITTNRGAIAILEAPATVELLDSPNAIRLHTGKLVGICETELSKGFLVRTPYLDITDLGTEFGIHVTPNRVTTTVFTGKVELTPPGGETQPLTANQTARVHVNGNNREVIVEDQLAKGFDRLLRPAVVTAARINLDGFEVRVVPRGVREDALLNTDRLHELNGIDANGIPQVLRGGDLVMMPCDARPSRTPGTEGLELELDLNRLADIYVLMPDISQLPAVKTLPDWLLQDYIQTDLRVGYDRGEGAYGETLGIGAGNSIDNHFIAWKRKKPALGKVTAAYGIDHTMYSVVVVPREKRRNVQP